MPRIHLIQEYEPLFYPFSTAHLLAHQAVGLNERLWAIFNTSELHQFWKRQNHKAEKTFVFEPRMNEKLRPFCDNLSSSEKKCVLLIYGRPNIPRNAFFLIERGLKVWAEKYGHHHKNWEILSAGIKHKNVPLNSGHCIKSLGKLSLEEYASLLRKTALGLSLMVSPHPSYPPLEMAHFGIRVITNSYTDKRPEERHENLISLSNFDPYTIADSIEKEILNFQHHPEVGINGQSFMPSFLKSEEIECAQELADAIVEKLC
jgi:hypothetical protein